MKSAAFLVLALLAGAPAFAQLAAPNAAGVGFGHVHINTSDIEAQKRFWTEAGGKIVQRDKMTLVEFPGGYIPLREQVPTGRAVGSTVNHIGLNVKDLQGSLAKWRADGMNVEAGVNANQWFLNGPDGIRVEILENTAIPGPIQWHHTHFFVTDYVAAQKWYADHFGGTPGKRLSFLTVMVPGSEITFSQTDMPQAPSEGRLIDHIGFEVRGLDAFVAKLQAEGIKTDAPVRNSTLVNGLRIVYITDPWGTKIELTEGLAK
jgi:catechol 2,3-dioxygenase-like lactoylglutathione lyase family enzyme